MEIGRVTAAHLNDPAFAAVDAHPFTGEFGRRYYPAVFGDRRRDESFTIDDRGVARLLVAYTAGEGVLDWYGMPIRMFARAGAASDAAIVEAALAHLDTLAGKHAAGQIAILEMPGLPLAAQCRGHGYHATEHDFASADLTGGEAGLRKGLRKSFKSLLNWGKRNLTLEIYGKANPGRALFKRYQDFHAQVAGRTTRALESWEVMADWIGRGHGELVLGSLDGELVTGTMVVDGAETAYYASGVYDRDRFDKPLAHWPLWLGMLHAGKRSMRVFDIGEIPRAGAAGAKEVNIGYFKRGFATETVTRNIWASEREGR
ncbi:MAG: GNAT family N-acetyltransferase [Stellaceae bacterium]